MSLPPRAASISRFGLLGLVGSAVVTAASAAELHVAPDGGGDYPTIQAAYDAAVPGDVVVLADGTFTGDGNRDLRLDFRGITIRSASGDPTRTILDGEGTFALAQSALDAAAPFERDRIEGVTLTGGAGTSHAAAAVFEFIGPITFESCWIVGNEGSSIVAASTFSDVTFRGCRIIGNRSRAATFTSYAALVSIEDSVIAANASEDDRGSVIVCGEGGGFRVERSVVSGNCSDVPGTPQFGFGDSAPGVVRLSCSVVDPGSLHDDVIVEGGLVEADPLFCDRDDCDAALIETPGDYHVAAGSPCLAAQHPCGIVVGGVSVGCDAVPVAAASWSTLKDRFEKGSR